MARKRAFIALAAAAASVAAFASSASAAGGYCTASGDQCFSIVRTNGQVLLKVSTAAKYYSRYRLCVKGPKSRVCKTFPVHDTGPGYGSTVNWAKNFPNQGKGLYRVTWSYGPKALTFTR